MRHVQQDSSNAKNDSNTVDNLLQNERTTTLIITCGQTNSTGTVCGHDNWTPTDKPACRQAGKKIKNSLAEFIPMNIGAFLIPKAFGTANTHLAHPNEKSGKTKFSRHKKKHVGYYFYIYNKNL